MIFLNDCVSWTVFLSRSGENNFVLYDTVQCLVIVDNECEFRLFGVEIEKVQKTNSRSI